MIEEKLNLSQIWKVYTVLYIHVKSVIKASRFKQNNILTDPKEIANQFNTYFTNVGFSFIK